MIINQKSISGAVRKFSYWVANGTIDSPNTNHIDYNGLLRNEPSALEMVYAIFINNLKFDRDGNVINAKDAESRAGLYVRNYFGGENNKLEDWEMELY